MYLLCKYKKVIMVYSVSYTKVLVVGKLNIRMTKGIRPRCVELCRPAVIRRVELLV